MYYISPLNNPKGVDIRLTIASLLQFLCWLNLFQTLTLCVNQVADIFINVFFLKK